MIRVAGPNQVPWEEGTEIKNISLSGLAFTAPADLCPLVGEVIKIQFEIPGAKQMACFGLVVRLDELDSGTTLVGIKFQNLEMAHKLFLLQGLALKLKEQQKQKEKIAQKAAWNRLIENKVATVFLLASLLVWAAIFYTSLKPGWIQSLMAILE